MRRTTMKRNSTVIAFLLAAVLMLLAVGVTAAAAGYTLFGNAVLVSPGNASPTAVQLSSVCPGGPSVCFAANGGFTFSGIDFAVPAGMTFSNLNNLATDYKFIAGGCGG